MIHPLLGDVCCVGTRKRSLICLPISTAASVVIFVIQVVFYFLHAKIVNSDLGIFLQIYLDLESALGSKSADLDYVKKVHICGRPYRFLKKFTAHVILS